MPESLPGCPPPPSRIAATGITRALPFAPQGGQTASSPFAYSEMLARISNPWPHCRQWHSYTGMLCFHPLADLRRHQGRQWISALLSPFVHTCIPMDGRMSKALAELFKALSDPTRLRILRLLMDGPHCVCEMQRALNLPQPLLSRHLAFLRYKGLVEGRRVGVRVNYRLDETNSTLQLFLPALREALEAEEQTRTAP